MVGSGQTTVKLFICSIVKDGFQQIWKDNEGLSLLFTKIPPIKARKKKAQKCFYKNVNK